VTAENLTFSMQEPVAAGADTTVLPAYMPIPGLGVLTMNAFVLHAEKPVLIDAGPGPLVESFLTALVRVIDPADLRYIWLTHTDPDHIGALDALAAVAPQARIVTPFLGRGKLGLQGYPLGDERFHLLEPGQTLDLGDRQLMAIRPPTYDAPETIAAFDTRTRALFSADAFGALLATPAASAAAIAAPQLRDGMTTWSGIDVPWLGLASPERFAQALDAVADLDPSIVLSAHLPPAPGLAPALLDHLAAAHAALAGDARPARAAAG
jgi:glyoxylase-like metal-dependent hydrolase (beta-lactamase superfamily II)